MEERLNKLVAQRAGVSRRQADELIEDGKVAVNGTVIRELGTKAWGSDTITVQGTVYEAPAITVYALYKPRGYVTSRVQQGRAPIVTELLPPEPAVYPVGRLDKDSEGLLIMCNDGALTNRLTHPKFEHRKTYHVVVWPKKEREPAQIKNKLEQGVKLGDGVAKAEAISVQPGENGTLEVTLTVREGRHHLIRRMCATLGLSVERLTRTHIGNFSLKPLKPGGYRVLSSSDLVDLETP